MPREVHLVHALFFVERRPRTVRIDQRDVRAHRRRQQHAPPLVGRQVGKKRSRAASAYGLAPSPYVRSNAPTRAPRSSANVFAGREYAMASKGISSLAAAASASRPPERAWSKRVRSRSTHVQEGVADLARRGAVVADPPLHFGHELVGALLDACLDRRIGSRAPQSVRVEPVGGPCSERVRRDAVGLVGEPRSHLRDHAARLPARELRRLPRGHPKGVRRFLVLLFARVSRREALRRRRRHRRRFHGRHRLRGARSRSATVALARSAHARTAFLAVGDRHRRRPPSVAAGSRRARARSAQATPSASASSRSDSELAPELPTRALLELPDALLAHAQHVPERLQRRRLVAHHSLADDEPLAFGEPLQRATTAVFARSRDSFAPGVLLRARVVRRERARSPGASRSPSRRGSSRAPRGAGGAARRAPAVSPDTAASSIRIALLRRPIRAQRASLGLRRPEPDDAVRAYDVLADLRANPVRRVGREAASHSGRTSSPREEGRCSPAG